jgi:hypothetical protein
MSVMLHQPDVCLNSQMFLLISQPIETGKIEVSSVTKHKKTCRNYMILYMKIPVFPVSIFKKKGLPKNKKIKMAYQFVLKNQLLKRL